MPHAPAAPRPSILITGAAGGFGHAVARRFAREGYFVGLTDLARHRPALEALQAELGGEGAASVHELDVTDEAQARDACAAFAETAGGLQVLYNNAGVMPAGDFESVPLSASRLAIDVNFWGTVNVTHAALPHLRATPGAHIVNVSSASALHGNPELVTYSAAKRAVLSFSESLDISLRGSGVAVSDLLPMYAQTALVSDQQHALRRDPKPKITANQLAESVWGVVRSRRFRSYVGADTKVFAPASRLLPYRLRKWVTRRVLGW